MFPDYGAEKEKRRGKKYMSRRDVHRGENQKNKMVSTSLFASTFRRVMALRFELREYLAEFIGTAVILLFGNGVGAQVNLNGVLLSNSSFVPVQSLGPGGVSALGDPPPSPTSISTKGSYLSITFGWGLGVAIAVYVTGGVSAHLNPVSLYPLSLLRSPCALSHSSCCSRALLYIVSFETTTPFHAPCRP